MPMKIVRDDITNMKCDAIVNAAKASLLGGGGVDGAIHKAAGKRLLWECMKLGGCDVGKAKITKGYKLPAKYIIHTVGPKWQGGRNGENELLASCYRECLRIASEHKCESIAFPLISTGAYGYPKEQAFKIAMDTITEFLLENEMLVYIVVFDKDSFKISEKLFDDITAYIDEKYVDNHPIFNMTRRSDIIYEDVDQDGYQEDMGMPEEPLLQTAPSPSEQRAPLPPVCAPTYHIPIENAKSSLADIVSRIDESFSQMLLRKIDEKGMSDVECYKKANINRKLFSKIRSNPHYNPSKTTAIAFAIALELSLEETKDMLMKAGFALSHSNKFDIIIEFFIINKIYNINEINEALFAFDQSLLGV